MSSKFARVIAILPTPSSVAIERLFSSTGRIFLPERATLRYVNRNW